MLDNQTSSSTLFGTMHMAQASNAHMSFTFNGTWVAVYGVVFDTDQQPTSTYSVDQVQSTFTPPNPSGPTQYNQVFFQTSLADGVQHKLIVTASNGSQENPFMIDYILYTPSTSAKMSPALTSPTVTPTPQSMTPMLGAILGGLIGGIAVILIGTLFGIWIYRRRRRHWHNTTGGPDMGAMKRLRLGQIISYTVVPDELEAPLSPRRRNSGAAGRRLLSSLSRQKRRAQASSQARVAEPTSPIRTTRRPTSRLTTETTASTLVALDGGDEGEDTGGESDTREPPRRSSSHTKHRRADPSSWPPPLPPLPPQVITLSPRIIPVDQPTPPPTYQP